MNPSSETPRFLLFMLFNAKVPVHSPLSFKNVEHHTIILKNNDKMR